jgi:hypothetical protein
MKLEPKYKLLIAAMVFITLLFLWFIWPTPYKSYTYHYQGNFSILEENRITHSVYTKRGDEDGEFHPCFLRDGGAGNSCCSDYKFGIIVCNK